MNAYGIKNAMWRGIKVNSMIKKRRRIVSKSYVN
jgi:hypothetical protein